MKILSIVGARPNFMKIAPIITEITKYNSQNPNAGEQIHHVLVHTGQHYDSAMSGSFFSDLALPTPDIYLGVGSGSHAVQTSKIMERFEDCLIKIRPDIVVVVGDVNSTLACALVTSKISFDSEGSRPLIAHIEAGLRSFDRSMPEEVNRIITDHISDMLFVTEESGVQNLTNEGIPNHKIFFVGNTMIDTLMAFKEKAGEAKILDILGLRDGYFSTVKDYSLITLHRPSNVDNQEVLLNIIEALIDISKYLPIIFPCHPRTQNRIKEFGLDNYFNVINLKMETSDNLKASDNLVKINKINLIDALSYINFLCLMSNARIVLTDSGGIQEETTCLNVPCITIRENTERPITVTQGTNIVAGVDKSKILKAFENQMRKKMKNIIPEMWDGKAAERILKILTK